MAKFSVVSEFLFLYLCVYLLYWVGQSVHLVLSEDPNECFGQLNRFLVSGYEVLIEQSLYKNDCFKLLVF